jgi:glutathione synthase/RimK-type ligase-like ATP-grasp enzyme
MTVLIVTVPGDIHSHAVRWAIEAMGGSAKIFYPADLCDGAQWIFDPQGSYLSTEYAESHEILYLDNYDTVWMRRPPALYPQNFISDNVERSIIEGEFATLARSVLSLVERGRFVVSPVDNARRSSLKPFQLGIAVQSGFCIPKTLISNCPKAIIEFYHSCKEDIIFKPFNGRQWPNKDGSRIVPTTELSIELLTACDLSASPGIYQQNIKKHSEVRATVMGRSVFAWEKRFDSRTDIDVDWRFAFKDAIHEIHRLPSHIEDACFKIMESLGLVFGCFDFAIDECGQYYFLEVNPQGQWLWGDRMNDGLNQLEGMAEFLLTGRADFTYSGSNYLRYCNIPSNLIADSIAMERTRHYDTSGKNAFYQAT